MGQAWMYVIFSITLVMIQSIVIVSCHEGPHATLVYSWSKIEFNWPSNQTKKNAIDTGDYIPEKVGLSGIKIYGKRVFVTTPRWKLGPPATISEVISVNNKPLLKPFPNWGMHTLHDCAKLQNVHSMEIDPNNGWLWMIDIGRVNIFQVPINKCPPKLIVYSLETNQVVRQFVFPNDVANHSTNFLNDIALDPVAMRVYITDNRGPSIVVYDYGKNMSWKVSDEDSMKVDNRYQEVTINNRTTNLTVAINGLALSPDFKTLYYSPTTSMTLYGVHTEQIKESQNATNLSVTTVGTKHSQTDGMYMGHTGLYYGALSMNALYKWERLTDAAMQGTKDPLMKTQTIIAKDNAGMQWVNSMSIDEAGYVWFTSTRTGDFLTNAMNFSDTNFRIWKIFMNDASYLSMKKTASSASRNYNLIGTIVAAFLLSRLFTQFQ